MEGADGESLNQKKLKLSALCSYQELTQVSKEQLLVLTPYYLP